MIVIKEGSACVHSLDYHSGSTEHTHKHLAHHGLTIVLA